MPNVDSGCFLRGYVGYPRPPPGSLNFSDPFHFSQEQIPVKVNEVHTAKSTWTLLCPYLTQPLGNN